MAARARRARKASQETEAPQVVLRSPHIERWIPVPDYPGFEARVWLNFPISLLDEASRPNATGPERTAIMQRIVLQHNGWGDEDGRPYPAADSAEFWDAIPTHLGACLLRGIRQEAARSPLASPTPRSIASG